MEYYIYYKNSFFPIDMVLEQLNKRNNWSVTEKKVTANLCWIAGLYKVCYKPLECYQKYVNDTCPNTLVRGDIPLYSTDYLFSRSLIKFSDKSILYKEIKNKYGETDYLIKTFNVNLKNINTYKNFIENSNYDFYLKPNEGGEREGQIKTRSYEEIVSMMKKWKNKFNKWQLQEFINSYTKTPSFIKVVTVVIIDNNNISHYVQKKMIYNGIIDKKTGYVDSVAGTSEGYYFDNSYVVSDFDKKNYIGKYGFADEIYDKILGKGVFNKTIYKKIIKILKEVLPFFKIKLNKKKIYFHILSSDFMIDDNLNVKFLETNIQPNHFITSYTKHSKIENVIKAVGGKKNFEKTYQIETEFLDELFSLTVDKIYPTKYKKKLNLLKKII